MTHEDTSFPTVAHTSAVPNFNSSVIRARVKDVRRIGISKANSIDIIVMSGNTKNGLTGLKIIDVYGMIRRPSYDLSTVTREAN